MKKSQENLLPLNNALMWIVFSTLLISGSAILGWVYFQHIRALWIGDEKYRIVAVVQTGPEKEALKTVYLEELLNLSVDKPSNIYQFSTEVAQRKLLASPLIKKANVKKILPGTIYIDYSIRQPIAYLADFTNTAIDADGVLIPFKPFFTPKKIPEIFLGETIAGNPSWGKTIAGDHINLAFELLKALPESTSYVRKIDVSKAFADSYGQRQIILVVEDWFEKNQEGKSILCICPRILRLSTATYEKELEDFIALRKYLQEQELQQIVDTSKSVVRSEPMIIDMRIPQLAFFKE